MRLYIVRHGDPDYERDDLTEEGLREAQALGEFLSRDGLEEIHSSPLGRAMRTASYTARATGLPLVVEDWARELDLRDDASGLMVWDYDPGLFAALGSEARGRALAGKAWMDIPPFDHPDLRRSLAGLESGADDFLARQGYFRENGIYRTSSENRRRIALFCHNGSGLALLALLLRIPLPSIWSGFFFRTSSVTTVLFEERASGIATARCIGLGDLSHLRLAGLDPGESGLKANVE